MDTSQDLDLLISKYSENLMQMKEKWSKWGIVTEEKTTDSEPAVNAVALTDAEDPAPEPQAPARETSTFQDLQA